MDEEGLPLFLPHVEQWLKAMRAKLLQWSGRLLAQVPCGSLMLPLSCVPDASHSWLPRSERLWED